MNQEQEKSQDVNVEETAEKKEQAAAKETKKKDKTIKIKQSEYDKLVSEAVENKEKYVRLYAEFENVRKRTERERLEFVKYANEEIITEFLDILDNIERSVSAVREASQDENIIKGLEMVMTNIGGMLTKHEVSPIKAVGKKFDHNCHEVMMQEETTEHEDQTVMQEFQKGYYLGEKVIRTAKVKLASNTQPAQQKETDAEQKTEAQ